MFENIGVGPMCANVTKDMNLNSKYRVLSLTHSLTHSLSLSLSLSLSRVGGLHVYVCVYV